MGRNLKRDSLETIKIRQGPIILSWNAKSCGNSLPVFSQRWNYPVRYMSA